jgi:1-acyl-sn-glycerol-3-phosphate acyltransferase
MGEVGVGRRRTGWALRFMAAVVRPLSWLLARREWRGAEHLPAEGGYITAINHNSYLDAFAYGHFQYDNGRPPRFFVKSSLFRYPLLGGRLRAAGQIPVERGSVRAADALRTAAGLLRAGECVAIYIEGTFTGDADLWPGTPKTGAARLALTSGAPIVPIAQWGAHEIAPPFPVDGRRVRPLARPTLRVVAGPPVDLSDLRERELSAAVLREATDRIMDAIIGLLEEIRGERHPSRGAGHDPLPQT